MKTVKREYIDESTGKNVVEIQRVSDETAERMVEVRHFHYCPKSEWKKNVRDKDAVAKVLAAISDSAPYTAPVIEKGEVFVHAIIQE